MIEVKLCPHGLPMYRNIPAGNEQGCADPSTCLEKLLERAEKAEADLKTARAEIERARNETHFCSNCRAFV